MIVNATVDEQRLILRGMLTVATAGGARQLADTDEAMIHSAWTYAFGHPEIIDAYLPMEGPDIQQYEHLLRTERYQEVTMLNQTTYERGQMKGRADMLVSEEVLAERRGALQAAGGYAYPASQTPWQEMQRANIGQFATGAVLEAAVKYQRIAQTKGLPRDNH